MSGDDAWPAWLGVQLVERNTVMIDRKDIEKAIARGRAKRTQEDELSRLVGSLLWLIEMAETAGQSSVPVAVARNLVEEFRAACTELGLDCENNLDAAMLGSTVPVNMIVSWPAD